MPSGPVAESELRFDSKLSTLSGEKDTESKNSWVRLGKVDAESDGFVTQDFEGNMEFRHSAFSRANCVAILGKGGDGGGTYTRNRLN